MEPKRVAFKTSFKGLPYNFYPDRDQDTRRLETELADSPSPYPGLPRPMDEFVPIRVRTATTTSGTSRFASGSGKQWSRSELTKLDGWVGKKGMVPIRHNAETGTGAGQEAETPSTSTTSEMSLSGSTSTDTGHAQPTTICLAAKSTRSEVNYWKASEFLIPAGFVNENQVQELPTIRIDKKRPSYYATVLNAKSPECMYISLLFQRTAREVLYEKIWNIYSGTHLWDRNCHVIPNPAVLVPGLFVICKYKDFWLRAQIISAVQKMENSNCSADLVYRVLFVDEGRKRRVHLTQLRYMAKHILEYPAGMQTCALFRADAQPWTMAALERFTAIMRPGTSVELRLVRKRTDPKSTWEVALKSKVMGNSSLDFRYVDIAKELTSHERLHRIAALYRPRKDFESDGDEN